LDIGCGKGFLLKEFVDVIPGIEVFGVDISEYAIQQAHPDVKKYVSVGRAEKLPFPDASIDLVLSINTLHNLRLPELETALREIERVGRAGKYIVMDGYRNEQEKVNLMYWQLTCECFFTPEEWEWLFLKCVYTGDYSLIYFS
jgi:protein-L-isoaspartate(D-aspartate) O-methyltransferase